MNEEEQEIYLYALKYALARKTIAPFAVINQFTAHIDEFDAFHLVITAHLVKEIVAGREKKDVYLTEWAKFLEILENKLKEKSGKND